MIIEITAAAIGGGMVGFIACAALTHGRVSDAIEFWDLNEGELQDAEEAHQRVTDALTTKQARIDRALEQITPGANATVKRIARILKGEAA